MTAHIVSISRGAYVELKENLAPECRFTDLTTYPGLNHVWFYTATGDVVVITPEPIAKLPSCKVEGIE